MYILASVELPAWANYPGLEAWKFFNLFVFIAVMIYILRRKISEALAQRRDAIKQELIDAQQRRERALAQVSEADTLLSRLDTDIQSVHRQAQQEAQSERERLAAATKRELEKLEQQARRELETADKIARKHLRQFFAKRSIDVARQTVTAQMKPEDDVLLISESIGELRRARV
ncbi:MAG TPA: ATP synthase F0 subunit B [Pyrinomonadaceae bacterium]|nr:ATP synthase F0 subunit B [Pyrinomonadaceae bacterium]